MSTRGLNLLVFRDGRRQVSGASLKSALLAQLEGFSDPSSSDVKIGALLRAGELECAVADATGNVSPFAELTDALAHVMLGAPLPERFENLRQAVIAAPAPEEMTVSTPEGFAYYALQPSAYARVLDKLPVLPERLVIIGIRSIGVTLSAVTASAARLRGSYATRITVRPGGHPYNRRTEFSATERQVIQRGISSAAGFLIVDEGPGLSGSSFLSVAEALEEAGVAQARIVLLPAHAPNPDALCSNNAAQRWRRFRCVPADCEPVGSDVPGPFIGGGQWRGRSFADESMWPALWSTMERLKYLAPGEEKELRLFKFGGLGHYGDCVLKREQLVAEAGFGPMPLREENGFISYAWLDGRPMAAGDLNNEVMARMAEYCAFRTATFGVSDADISLLQEMAMHNLAELGFDLPVLLRLERPVIADGRMQPYKWIRSSGGAVLKTDSGSHGDDHFYPGPTDIAWDLAGTIVEWGMNAEQSTEFLHLYRRASGDDPSARINDYIRAYAVFRCAYCKMAGNAMEGSSESTRLVQAAAGYAALLRAISRAAQPNPEELAPATLAS